MTTTTTKTPATTTTTTTTTVTTAAPVTVATTEKPATTPIPTTPTTTTTSSELTTPSTTLPPQPVSTQLDTTAAPTTPLTPEVTTGKEEEIEAGGLVIVTQRDTEGVAVTRSALMVATELVPVTVADGLSGDLDSAMPLMIPDSSPLEESAPSDTQEAGGAPSLGEPPTKVSSAPPHPTPFPVGKPDDSETSLYQDLTQTSILMPTEDTQTEAGNQGTEPKILPGVKEEVGVHTEVAVQSENDTATFSAATVLSGDGEVEPPSYPLLQDTDSELDYQYDPADAFLPVSSAVSLFLLLVLLLLPLKASAASQRSQLLTALCTPTIGTKLKPSLWFALVSLLFLCFLAPLLFFVVLLYKLTP